MDISNIPDAELEQELAKRAAAKKQIDVMEKAKAVAKLAPLKANAKTLVKLNYGDLEDFVRQTFGVRLEAACVEEMSNDTDKEYAYIGHGDKAFRNEDFDDKNVEDFLFGHKHDLDNHSLNCLLEWLAVRGFIPVGDYLVSFSW